jgi:hypothetical protein
MFKQHAGLRKSQTPELTYANFVLLQQQMAAQHFALGDGQFAASQAIQDLLEKLGWGQLPQFPKLDIGVDLDASIDDFSGCCGKYYHMLGAGRSPSSNEAIIIAKALRVLLASRHAVIEKAWQNLGVHNWLDLACASLLYNRAQCGPFSIAAQGKDRARARANYYVQVSMPLTFLGHSVTADRAETTRLSIVSCYVEGTHDGDA